MVRYLQSPAIIKTIIFSHEESSKIGRNGLKIGQNPRFFQKIFPKINISQLTKAKFNHTAAHIALLQAFTQISRVLNLQQI
jgi:hypothetical protein